MIMWAAIVGLFLIAIFRKQRDIELAQACLVVIDKQGTYLKEMQDTNNELTKKLIALLDSETEEEFIACLKEDEDEPYQDQAVEHVGSTVMMWQKLEDATALIKNELGPDHVLTVKLRELLR